MIQYCPKGTERRVVRSPYSMNATRLGLRVGANRRAVMVNGAFSYHDQLHGTPKSSAVGHTYSREWPSTCTHLNQLLRQTEALMLDVVQGRLRRIFPQAAEAQVVESVVKGLVGSHGRRELVARRQRPQQRVRRLKGR